MPFVFIDFPKLKIQWKPPSNKDAGTVQIVHGSGMFTHISNFSLKEAVGAFVVFDVTRTDTFAAVEKWKNDLDTKVLLPDGRPIPCVLVK